MSRLRRIPQLRQLVGEAVYELLFSVTRILSPELLEEIAASQIAESLGLYRLESPPSVHRLGSTDGNLRLEVQNSGISLHTYDYQGFEGVNHLERLATDVLAILRQDRYERVLLTYSGAVAIEAKNVKNLFAERVTELLPDPGEEFFQQVSGTWPLGYYRLHYGIQPLKEKTFYLSRALVSAENVVTDKLGKVFGDLDEEGLRLLSWPIAPKAIETVYALHEEGHSYGAHEIFLLAHRRHDPMSSRSFEADVDEVNSERIELLGCKYGAENFSMDDELRLDALTERVRTLLPQVTRSDWQAVEDVQTRLGEVEERTRQVRARYGLNG